MTEHHKDGAANGGADLSQFDMASLAGVGTKMEVRSPLSGEVLRHDDGRPFTITYIGRDSPIIQDLIRQQTDRRTQFMLRTRTSIPAATIEKDDVDLLVAATLEWDIILGGKPAPSNSNAYRELYANPSFRWLREQGDEFVGVRSNFTRSKPAI